MKKLLLSLLILMIAFGVTRLALAGDSATIRMSCTIPQVPGVNIGIVKENQTLQNAFLSETLETQELITNIPIAFQKDSKEMRMINGHTIQLEIRTIYSR